MRDLLWAAAGGDADGHLAPGQGGGDDEVAFGRSVHHVDERVVLAGGRGDGAVHRGIVGRGVDEERSGGIPLLKAALDALHLLKTTQIVAELESGIIFFAPPIFRSPQ